MRAQLVSDPNGTGIAALFDARIKTIEEGLNQMRLHQVSNVQTPIAELNQRTQTCAHDVFMLSTKVEELLHELAEDRGRFQDLHAEIQIMKQDQWWDHPSDISPSHHFTPKTPEPPRFHGSPKHETFDLFEDDDHYEGVPRRDDEDDVELKSLRMKDIHHFRVPALPTDAVAYRQWKNSLRTMVMSYDRSPNGAVMGWLTQSMTAKTDGERQSLKNSSGDFPRFDRILAAAFCKPEHLRSIFGVRFNAYLEEWRCRVLRSGVESC